MLCLSRLGVAGKHFRKISRAFIKYNADFPTYLSAWTSLADALMITAAVMLSIPTDSLPWDQQQQLTSVLQEEFLFFRYFKIKTRSFPMPGFLAML